MNKVETSLIRLGDLKYKYDRSGNISEIWENGLLSVRYTYDKLQRLIREDNLALGKTWLWTYDNFGNILYRRTANYTTKPAEEIGTFLEETAYAYDGSRPDRLVSYRGADDRVQRVRTCDELPGESLTKAAILW